MQPNIHKYRIIKDNTYMIQLHESTSVSKSVVKGDGFVRYPFQIVNFDDLQPTCKKYLVGKVSVES